VRNIEGPGNLADRLALGVASPDRLALLDGEFEFRSHFHAPRLGAFAAFARAGADQYSPSSTVRATRRGGGVKIEIKSN
jgi:hypothetical protein